jgi:hypothetical protein
MWTTIPPQAHISFFHLHPTPFHHAPPTQLPRHKLQNCEQRSCRGTADWDMRQHRGEWLHHIRAVAGKLGDQKGLAFVGLSTALSPVVLDQFRGDSKGEVMYLAELSELYGHMVTELMGLRIRCPFILIVGDSQLCDSIYRYIPTQIYEFVYICTYGYIYMYMLFGLCLLF